MSILELSEAPFLIEEAVQFFWSTWGNEENFMFYRDCILHSLDPANKLPKFYIVQSNQELIASYALLTNDLISRQDLMPWFACLFVKETYRNQGIAGMLLTHGLEQARKKGFPMLYLSTDLQQFYEKKGWQIFGTGYSVADTPFQIYAHPTKF